MHTLTRKTRVRVLGRFQEVVSALRKGGREAEHDQPGVLAILHTGAEREKLAAIFRGAGWKLMVVDTVSAAIAAQTKHPVPVILCERNLPEGDWQHSVCILASLPEQPWVILLSSHCDQNLWDNLTAMGGSDLLRTPLDRERVLQAVGSGWRMWRHMRQLRSARESRR